MGVTDLTIRTYDEHLVKKLESAIMKVDGKPVIDVIYSPYDLAFEYAMKRQQVVNKNQMKFPMIICHRSSGFEISDMTHRVSSLKQTIHYIKYENEAHEKVTRSIQVIHVNIPYTIEIITKDETQAFELAQELIFLFLRDPSIEVPKFVELSDIPDIAKTNFIFTALLDNDIADNTDLEAESDIGKLYRLTLSVRVSDAALTRDITEHLIKVLDIRVETENSLES